MKYTKLHDGSILDETGKIIFFSLERFVKDICEGNCCFICGKDYCEEKFNNEHILPDWILKKYNLYDKTIDLPNNTKFRYDQYVVSCCEDCNSLMGNVIETPVSKLISNGYACVTKHLQENGPRLFFVWISLIFIKTHLKDKTLRLHQDQRKEDGQISDPYQWEELHHIHCIARSFYTNANIEAIALGSFVLLPARVEDFFVQFDYADMYYSQSVLLRLDDICFVTVLDDYCAAFSVYKRQLEKIKESLSPLQLQEIFVHLSYINLLLENRPTFSSRIDCEKGCYSILGEHPDEWKLGEHKFEVFGEMLYKHTQRTLNQLKNEDKLKIDNIDLIQEKIKKGEWSFLFNNDGEFMGDSMIPVPINDE